MQSDLNIKHTWVKDACSILSKILSNLDELYGWKNIDNVPSTCFKRFKLYFNNYHLSTDFEKFLVY